MTNKILKEKYERNLQTLKKANKKFTDEYYPPLKTSLCLNSSISSYSDVRWLRISDVFKGRYIQVWDRKSKAFKIKAEMKGCEYIAEAFSLIKNSDVLLEKMF